VDYARAPLTRWERTSLVCLLAVIVAFGVLVEFRAAFFDRRMSDLTVFFRAGWAVRTGEDIYKVSDERNGWYYVYPPFFAILMAPLAEAPPGADQSWMVPYSVSVAFWYVFNVVLLFWSVHCLAKALQAVSSDAEVRDQPAGCRRWWMMRMLPIYACLIPIGSTLSHGQTNIVILAMLCGMLSAVPQKKSFQAGLWMAGPICMKVFPAFLLIYPLWRRDWRCLGGCAAGLFVGLIALPGAVFGPERTVTYYQEFADLVLLPGVGQGNNKEREATLTAITKTDTQSFMAMMHNAQYLTEPDYLVPPNPSDEVRATHWTVGGLLTLIVCLAAGWRRAEKPVAEMLFLGLLIMLMMFLSPVCHLPYFAWLVPVVMALLLLHWEFRRNLKLSAGLMTLICVNIGVHILAHMTENPEIRFVRDLGFATCSGLAIGVVGVRNLYMLSHEIPITAQTDHRAAA
jgi:Glycosyltransferase family 87